MKINQCQFEVEGLQAELQANRRLVENIKDASIMAERKILELESREQIAIEEKMEVKRKYNLRIE